MKKYKFSFTGRKSGAIGIFYKITAEYTCKDIHEAFSKIYTNYEHIKMLTITENGKKIEQPDKINWVTT